MKEVKKTGHSKNNNNNVKKKPINKKIDNDAPRVTKIESPVKEAKVVKVDNDFVDEENDQKLIVVIAIALLVIIATVIGLLVGCEKKEEEEPEEPKDDIVVPVEKEDDETEEEEPVKKTTVKVTDEEETEDVEVVIPMYDVTYYYSFNERTHHESVLEGNAASEYVPSGYNSCKYYADEEFETEYAFDNLYEDSNIYLDCETIKYTVVYRFEENDTTNNELNETEFTVEDDIELKDLETTEIFMGWYLDNEYTKRVYALNRDLTKYADNENVVYLYAKVEEQALIKLYNVGGDELLLEEVLRKESAVEYTLPSTANLNVCSTNGKFLGWTSVQGSKNVEYKDEAKLVIDNDYTLYAVCGDATIQYESNGETVTVAYTKDELAELEGLPKPSDMDMETPSYYVPVTEEVLESLKIVSDDELELKENEVYLKDVVGNTREDYVPTVGDRVQAFEKEFVGWIEKTEEVETPENEEENVGSENTTVEATESIEGEDATEVTEEELDLVTKEEVVERVEDGETEIELEAVWEIPEEDLVVEDVQPEVEVTPELDAPIA